MNSLKKGEGVSLLNFVGGRGVPPLNFEGGLGVPLLNFRGVPGPTFILWGGSRVPESRGPGSRGTGLTFYWSHHAVFKGTSKCNAHVIKHIN